MPATPRPWLLLSALFMIVTLGCSGDLSDDGDRTVEALAHVKTFPGAAERMPPGARAVMTFEAFLDGHEFYLYAQTGAFAADLWEAAASACVDDPDSFVLNDSPRAVPTAEDPFWTTTNLPTSAFRPLDGGWAEEHGFGPAVDARLDDPRLAFLSDSVGQDACVFDRLPFDGPDLGHIDELDDPIGYLAVELSSGGIEALDESAAVRRAFEEQLYALVEDAAPLADYEACMRDQGMSEEVVTGDFFEAIAMSSMDQRSEIARADARCLSDQLSAIDDELFDHVEAFTTEHVDFIASPPDVGLDDLRRLAGN